MDTNSHKLVQIIMRKNDMSLVQWLENGSPSRAWVTPDMIVSTEDKGRAIVDSPNAGIPFGVEWSRMVEMHATPKDLEKNMRLHGIWTVADLRGNPDGARAALQATYGIDVASLQRLAKDLNSGGIG